MEEDLKLLTETYQNYDWFHSVGVDSSKRYVIYVTRMGLDVWAAVPDKFQGVQVLCHFAGSKTSNPNQYVSPGVVVQANPVVTLVSVEDEVEELPSSFLEADLSELCRELDRLEKQCGSNCLQDIFYEVHDGENAVTNLSAKYPDVRKGLEKLYDEYGFDVIYEELDG